MSQNQTFARRFYNALVAARTEQAERQLRAYNSREMARRLDR